MTARQVGDGGCEAASPNGASTAGSVGTGSASVARIFDDIAKPEADNRDYRGLQLSNGMKVCLQEIGFLIHPERTIGIDYKKHVARLAFCDHE